MLLAIPVTTIGRFKFKAFSRPVEQLPIAIRFKGEKMSIDAPQGAHHLAGIVPEGVAHCYFCQQPIQLRNEPHWLMNLNGTSIASALHADCLFMPLETSPRPGRTSASSASERGDAKADGDSTNVSNIVVGGQVFMEMVHVSEGAFLFGRDVLTVSTAPKVLLMQLHMLGKGFSPGTLKVLDEGTREHVAAFLIGKYPVMNWQYKVFVDETGREAPISAANPRNPDNWVNGTFPKGKDRFPVCLVSLDDMRSFCEWLSEKAEMTMALPSSVQWEYAASGPRNNIFPWGDEFRGDIAVWTGRGADGPEETGRESANESWCGAIDMAGNVMEVTQDGKAKGGGYSAREGCNLTCCYSLGHSTLSCPIASDVGFRVAAL